MFRITTPQLCISARESNRYVTGTSHLPPSITLVVHQGSPPPQPCFPADQPDLTSRSRHSATSEMPSGQASQPTWSPV